MSEPAALDYARALIGHAQRLGGPLSAFDVLVNKAEGFELIDWLYEKNKNDTSLDVAQLSADIAEAKRIDDPFIVLNHFTILGLNICLRVLH